MTSSDQVLELANRAEEFDGFAPFNEATVFALNADDEPAVNVRLEAPGGILTAAALGFADSPVELVVDPKFRRGGLGRTVLDSAMAEGGTQFWAHGNLPAAQGLAHAAGLRAVRSLLVLRLVMTVKPLVPTDGGITLRGFTDADTDALIDVNARAFASHPEQG